MIMPTASEPIRHHHAHPIDFESVREVPDSHAWPDLHDHPTASAQGAAVPVIDLSATATNVLEQLARACESWGAFQVTGHGVPTGLLRRVEAAARGLFALPTNRKLEAARPDDGVSGYGRARISCFFPKLMWSEGFTIAGSPLDHARTLWPDDDPLAFCDVIEEYKEEMKKLARKLMRMMLVSLGLTVAEAEGKTGWIGPSEEAGGMSAVLQLNSYPVCPDPDRAMGMAAHTDSTLLTLLFQSNTSGLQVLQVVGDNGRDRTARWVTVPPMPGALIVNVGDLFQILSNGRYRSVVHRAVVSRTSHRVSVAYMCGPPAASKVEPIGKLVGPGCGPVYRPVTWPEYLSVKGKLFDKALASVMRTEVSLERI
ncbi:gibberellin 3-beta-dioxygenase [Musa troglodytarum]|uniref:gibberellin 3beta-dioxygenase n=1 Tax=Musa troglodytarum TaxID=320322 RepID=A0A9E7G3W7_9LILI|nr:gibberellin 3-beta-dioxygenase [Musa troglodytarum]